MRSLPGRTAWDGSTERRTPMPAAQRARFGAGSARPTWHRAREGAGGGESSRSLSGRGDGRLGDDRQHDVRRPARGVVNGVAGGKPACLVEVAAAGVQVSVVAREAAARDLETHPMPHAEEVAGRLEVDAQAIRAARLHPDLASEALAIARAEDGFLGIVGG